jgi:hypothetical protein
MVTDENGVKKAWRAIAALLKLQMNSGDPVSIQ